MGGVSNRRTLFGKTINKTNKQNDLRKERSALFAELINICGKDKKIIQLARKYYREDTT